MSAWFGLRKAGLLLLLLALLGGAKETVSELTRNCTKVSIFAYLIRRMLSSESNPPTPTLWRMRWPRAGARRRRRIPTRALRPALTAPLPAGGRIRIDHQPVGVAWIHQLRLQRRLCRVVLLCCGLRGRALAFGGRAGTRRVRVGVLVDEVPDVEAFAARVAERIAEAGLA